jgi:hypothetical protein
MRAESLRGTGVTYVSGIKRHLCGRNRPRPWMAPRAGSKIYGKHAIRKDGGSAKRADTPSNTPRVPVHL